MNKRPRSITVISCIFLAAGFIGLAYHATEFNARSPFEYDVVWVCFVRLLAILCGVFMLRGSNWPRWLLVVWLGYHVILSVLHTPFELLVHFFAPWRQRIFDPRHRRRRFPKQMIHQWLNKRTAANRRLAGPSGGLGEFQRDCCSRSAARAGPIKERIQGGLPLWIQTSL